MSFILDALNRAEQERKMGDAPGLNTQFSGNAKRSSTFWPWLVALLVIINLAVLAWLYFEFGREPLRDSTNENLQIESADGAASTIPVLPKDPLPNTPHVVLEKPTTIAETQQPKAQSLPANPPKETQPRESIAVTAAPEPSPTIWELDSLDESENREMSKHEINMHVYDANPASRFVFMQMEKRTEGDSLPNGDTLDEITPDGVIVDHNGKLIRIPTNR